MGDVRVGQELPPFTRRTGLHHFNRYAAVNDEFVPIHMDDEAGRAAGYPSAFGQGNLQWSFLHNVIRQWIGDDGIVERVTCTFRGANLKGQTVTAGGRVTGVRVDAGDRIVDLEVWTENEVGEPLAPGTATVRLPAPG